MKTTDIYVSFKRLCAKDSILKCLTHELFYKIRIKNQNKLKLVVFLKMFPRWSQLTSVLEYSGLESVLICTQCTGLYADVSISLH